MSNPKRPLYEIGAEVKRKWDRPYFGAVPYINALCGLSDIRDYYGLDEGRGIVLYFLANAKTWKGEDARRIKAELKSHLNP